MTSALALALPIADPDSSLTIPAIEPKIPRQSDSEFAKRFQSLPRRRGTRANRTSKASHCGYVC